MLLQISSSSIYFLFFSGKSPSAGQNRYQPSELFRCFYYFNYTYLVAEQCHFLAGQLALKLHHLLVDHLMARYGHFGHFVARSFEEISLLRTIDGVVI